MREVQDAHGIRTVQVDEGLAPVGSIGHGTDRPGAQGAAPVGFYCRLPTERCLVSQA